MKDGRVHSHHHPLMTEMKYKPFDGALPCPCCSNLTIYEPGSYEICEICEWEDDPVQSDDPSYAGGANKISLDEARRAWAKKQSIDPSPEQ
jgi:hypothetical protein